MSVTPVGLLLIPLGLVLAAWPSRWPLLGLTVFFSPFTATAVLNFPAAGFGVQPAYWLATLWIARVAVERLRGGEPLRLGETQLRPLRALWAFLGLAVLSACLVPWYDPGTLVRRPSGALTSLAFTTENVTQLLYVGFAVVTTTAVGTARLTPGELRRTLRVFVLSAGFVAAWGWLQIGSYVTGIEYPAFLFNNSESYRQLFQQQLAGLGIRRMSSVAPEPSMLARFLILPFALCLHSALSRSRPVAGRRAAIAATLFFGVTMIATTSSTAFLGLGVSVLVVGGWALTRRLRDGGARTLSLASARRLALAGAVTAAVALPAAMALLGIGPREIRPVLETVLLDKLSSASGQTRLSTALDALALAARHPLLGVGWGSFRSFDLFTNLLVGSGILGLGAFAWAHLRLWDGVRWQSRGMRREGRGALRDLPAGLLLALAAALIAKLASEPGLVFLDYWLLFGLAVATLRWPRSGRPEPAGEPAPGDGHASPSGRARRP